MTAQNSLILEQEKELLRLKTAREKVGDGWSAALPKLNKDIKNQTAALAASKLELKEIKQEQKEATAAVKEFNDVRKGSLMEDIKNYKVFGLSINGIGKAFGKIIPAAKAAFATIKAGMISTGIGALLVAFGSLVAWFTQTKAGAEALSKIFAVVGTAVKVFVDRLISYGKLLASIVTLDFKGMASNAKAAFGGIGEELKKEIKLAMELADATHRLADAERALKVETSQRKAEIEDLKLKSQDLNLTEQERLDALEKAGAIETRLMADRVANAEEAVRIQQQQMSMSKDLAADLDKLAEKEIALANIRRESARTQTTITMKANRIRKQVAAKEEAAQKAWISRQNEKIRKQNEVVIKFNEMWQDEFIKQMSNEQSKENALAKLRFDAREEEIMKNVFDEEKRTALIAKNFTHHENELREIRKKFRKKDEEVKKQSAADLLAIENETFLIGIENERDKADESLRIQKELELKSVEGRVDTAELQAAIEDKYIALSKEKKDLEAEQDKARAKEVAAAKVELLAQGLAVFSKILDVQGQDLENNYKKEKKLAEANGKSTEGIEAKYEKKRKALAKKQKKVKVGLAIIDTYQSAVAAYAAGLSIPGPTGLVMGPVSAALAVAAGLANVAMIMKTDVGGGGGGGGGAGGGGAPAPAPPAKQMMSGAFNLEGGEEPEPLKAFVVTDEMTDSQNQLSNIRRRATI